MIADQSLNVNERRAIAIRRHRGKPQVIAALKDKIRDAVLRDCAAKEIAALAGITATAACRWIHALGFRRMYVSHEERRQLFDLRKKRSGGITA